MKSIFRAAIVFISLVSLQTVIVSANSCSEEPVQNVPDECASTLCPSDSVCVPDKKVCFTEPCPQVKCVQLSEPCVRSGCSEEICGDAEMLSPCIFDEKFKCLGKYAECKRGANGTCFWHYADMYEQSCQSFLAGNSS